jgi:putative transposase
MPAAIAAQNRRRSSRPAIGGRPGERNGARPDRSERRFRILIATSFIEALRRPLESAQYAAGDYRDILQAAAIVQSMSRKGNCWDNAPMESFFGTLKTELVHHGEYSNRDAARHDLFAYIEGYYNRQRRHSAIGYITPEQAEARAA